MFHFAIIAGFEFDLIRTEFLSLICKMAETETAVFLALSLFKFLAMNLSFT
jgi:hypothetical protein